ncbi:HNH endonuclease [Burkholderia ubonensis]|uniref:HNH endonuclease n=1 Tax=Burkholderia ubonensis TaxID=101571 RepID=UPI000F55B5F4|nr:HNH endonuclease [Burkholderia ubonensis]RQP34126.1 HNH endonuclease [Burkholderia ubonensis]RQP40384.1 HNH endonuclease [Burkholderia ubonensis]RQP40523.1 HNH endonuclease [Burkholderia ubonensis]RQP53917.1 HNH endonuclease [Burkholderia ubonensis]RQP57399.1 HNH endonuclease [Burkholderia ubonensis]
MLCIICREDKEDMSDEHVIPDSLGGFYHIFNVCKTCNSKMGEKVDSPLVNHKLTELYRFAQEIEGKSGSIPNPFSGIFIEEGNPEVKARAAINKEGKLEIMYHPVIKLKEEAGVVQTIEIAVDSKDERKIDEILQKILIRKGIPESAIIKGERRREIRTGGVGGKWEIDILKFKIGLLKIAYEFAVDSIPEFLSDADAVKISGILKNADYEGVKEYVKIGSGFQPEIFEPFSSYLDLSSKKHYLVLTPTKFGLLCLVKLHNLFSIGAVLSKGKFMDFTETLVGVNDIDGGSFRKLRIPDLISECMGPQHTRFCYQFPNELERAEGQAEIESPGYRYEGNEKAEIPLYKRNGERHPFLAHQLLDNSQCQSRKEGNWQIELFWFDPNQEYFVKAVGSGNLYRVIAFELSREQTRKV